MPVSCTFCHCPSELLLSICNFSFLDRPVCHSLRGVLKKEVVFVVFGYEGEGVGGNVKRLRGYFYKLCFFGVFQNGPGPPKYALELRDYVKYMFLSPFHSSL